MNRKRTTVSQVLLEIAIVIIGISIAFWVNNWGEKQKENRQEIAFIETLVSDLRTDSASFHYQIENVAANIENLNSFIDLLIRKDFKNDSLQWFVGNFLNRNNWIINSNTFDILKSGGKLDVIEDFKIRNDISFFYNIRTFQTIEVLNLSQEFLYNKMDDYLTRNSDFFISNSPDNSFTQDREFQNLVGRWRDLKEEKLSIYRDTYKDINALIPKLEAYLKSK